MKKPFFSQIINPSLFLSAIASLFLTGAVSAQQAVAGGPFAIQEGTLEFTSEWIAIANPLITTAALDLKVQASQETLADDERLSVIVEVEAGKSVTLVELGAGDNWGRSPMLIRSGLGELAQNSGVATRCRFIITGSSTSDATRIEISDLRVEETGRLPEDPLLDASLVRFEFYAGLLDNAGEPTFTLGFEDLDEREALNFQVHYIGLVKPIDPATLGNDDICVDGEDTFGFELEVSLVSSQVMPNADVIATYSLQRPEVGWEPLESLGTLELIVCLGGVRSTSGNRQFGNIGQLALGTPSWQDVVAITTDGPPKLESLDQPYTDVEFLVNGTRIPRGELETGDIVQVVELETYPAELLETGEMNDDDHYKVVYRFTKPPGGWPYFRSGVAFSPEFRKPRVTERISPYAEGQFIFITYLVNEQRTAPISAIMEHGEADALSADSFELSIDFVSEHGIDLASIGDGDLQLRHYRASKPSYQNGELVGTSVHQDGKRVTAVYKFQRDPNATFAGTWINVHSPRGGVSDLMGNTTPGTIHDEFKVNGQTTLSKTPFQFVRQSENLPIGDFDFGFIPLSAYDSDLENYHFRIIYRSAVPIDLDDFVAHRHLTGETQPLGTSPGNRLPDLYPELTRWRSSDEGRLVEGDYVMRRPEWGWPKSVAITLNQQGIRDTEKRLPRVPANAPNLGIPIADLGGNVGEAIRTTILGGHEVSADAATHQVSVLLEANERLEASEFADSNLWFGWHPELLPGLESFEKPFPVPGRLTNFVNVLDEDIPDYDLRVFFGELSEGLPQSGAGTYDIWISGETRYLRAFARDGRVLFEETDKLNLIGQLLFTENALKGRAKVRDLSQPVSEYLIGVARDRAGIDGNLAVATYEVERPAEGWEAWDIGRVPFILQVPAVNYQLTRIAGSDPFVGYVDILSQDALPLLKGFEDWVRELEKQSEIPAESLVGDVDGDGQSGLVEYALGGDPVDGSTTAHLVPGIDTHEGDQCVEIIVPVRRSATGVTIEVQESIDGGKTWHSVQDHFEMKSREPSKTPDVDHLILRATSPIANNLSVSLYRVLVVR